MTRIQFLLVVDNCATNCRRIKYMDLEEIAPFVEEEVL